MQIKCFSRLSTLDAYCLLMQHEVSAATESRYSSPATCQLVKCAQREATTISHVFPKWQDMIKLRFECFLEHKLEPTLGGATWLSCLILKLHFGIIAADLSFRLLPHGRHFGVAAAITTRTNNGFQINSISKVYFSFCCERNKILKAVSSSFCGYFNLNFIPTQQIMNVAPFFRCFCLKFNESFAEEEEELHLEMFSCILFSSPRSET